MVLWIVLAIVILLVVVYISIYNKIIKMKNRVESSSAQIDAHLKQRYDLVPNLVEIVKGYAKHEKETLTAVIEARNVALNATSLEDKESANKGLSSALKSIFALAENYPDLKANEGFVKLQVQLTEIEEKILQARKYYNAVIREFNYFVELFPSSIVANLMHQNKRNYLEIDEVEKKRVDIKF
ncbi:MAG: LemA family protein [Sphaerochaetaceae bacterium]|nr:LemA family protein [Sphaerochaetaceae bacterium]